MHPRPVELIVERIKQRQYTIGIIGLGYVGLPLMTTAAGKNFKVIGLDTDEEKINALNSGKSYIKGVKSELVESLRQKNLIEPTVDAARVREMDAIIICVPTPLDDNREPNLKPVISAMNAVAPHMRAGQILILESTTYPGTTRELIVPIIESTGLVLGKDVWLAFSPEREDPGNANFETSTIPKVVGGHDDNSLKIACAIYDELICQTVPVSNTDTAEAVKLLENIFRSVNIGLVNELKVALNAMDIDIHEVIRAASTKPFGYHPFQPGPGVGGHCIPIDPLYFTWKANKLGVSTPLTEMAVEINESMPAYVVDRLEQALKDNFGKKLEQSTILIVGITYKKNIDDIRESPSFSIIDLLQSKKSNVFYFDPYVKSTQRYMFNLSNSIVKESKLDKKSLSAYDAAIIVTDHDDVNYQMIVDHCPLVVDARNATHNLKKNAVVIAA